MKPKEFFDAVVRMREKQREYFKTKTSSALTESKRLERVIDDEIERVQRGFDKRSGIFRNVYR